jgi:hypothetical protein
VKLLDQVLLGGDVMFCGRHCRLLCLEILQNDIALLQRDYAFLDQRFVPLPGHFGEVWRAKQLGAAIQIRQASGHAFFSARKR